jgi:hypothetical protein
MNVTNAIAFYNSARTEMLERMKIRDNLMIVYIGVVITIFTIAINTGKCHILYCIPYFGLGISFLVSQHYEGIGKLALFCAKEIGQFLKKNNAYAPQWDGSEILLKHPAWAVIVRGCSHGILLGLPSLMALVYNKQELVTSQGPYVHFLWFLGIICVLGTFLLLIISHVKRINLYKDWPKNKQPDMPTEE